jgi:uroporphyrinogen decarboxylase
MRQAGRYLPEYQKLRTKYPLKELFFTPTLAAEITLMPITRFGVDAAILFSDILAIAPALGLSLDFQEGPVVYPRVNPNTPLTHDLEPLAPIFQTVQLAKQQLSVPLIGFCGGPFTVASYLIEEHSGSELPATKRWMYTDPATFHTLLDHIADLSIAYLQEQIKSGVDAVQIFDSWAHVLGSQELEEFSLAYLKKILRHISVPTILFMRGSSFRAEQIARIQPGAISLDWHVPIEQVREKTHLPLQGNFDPDLLFAPLPLIAQRTAALCTAMKDDPSFIANLGHGVKPGTPIEAVECFIRTVKGI